MSGINWGQALAAGLQSGAQAEVGQLSADADEQRWLDREKQMQAAEADRWKNQQRYLIGLKPPEKQTIQVLGPDGKTVMNQAQRWNPPSEEDGETAGTWSNVGDPVPDVNQAKVEESIRNHDLISDAKDAARAASEREAAARIDAAYARIDAANARNQSKATDPKPYTSVDPKTGQAIVRYGWYGSDGKFQPAMDENGNPLGGAKFRPDVWTEKRNAATEGVDAVKGTLSQISDALGLTHFADAVGAGNVGRGPGNRPPPTRNNAPPTTNSAAAAPVNASNPTADGSSPSTPLKYQPGMPKPPAGTYVQKPDGSIVQVQQ